jgi:NADH-quinone oxidoreductase subunit J
MGVEIAFWALTVLIIGAALAVVLTRDLFRAALFLVGCFLAVAGIFVTLSADFLAAAQILIYVGAISVLIILAIMLTREVQRGNISNKLSGPALLVTLIITSVFSTVMLNTDWNISTEAPTEPTTGPLASSLFSESFVLPVEISAMVLLAAILGAIVLVREK